MDAIKTVLFLCTANYYRSRFAEEYFNLLATRGGLPVRADSAGLEMRRWRSFNPGELSPHTKTALAALGYEADASREPRQFESAMLDQFERCIALSEAEHRPMVERDYPELISSFEFWTVEDVELEHPDSAIRRIRESVDRCLDCYRSRDSAYLG